MIVTSIDEKFLPGLIALHNSIKRNSPDTPLACFTYGDNALADRVRDLDIKVHHNVDINSYLPPGDGTEEGCQPMYARLLAPRFYDKCVWMDADQIVQGDLTELFELDFSEPIAAVADTYNAQRSIIGIELEEVPAIMSGLMVFNVPEWKRLNLFEKCLRLMGMKDVEFRFVVQSVLNVALNGNFHRLHSKWQGFANRQQTNAYVYKVLHWHGRVRKPWTHPDMPNAVIWRQYQ